MTLIVYTAGKMPEKAERPSINRWRKALEDEVFLNGLDDVIFNHPEFAGCDHGGIHPAGTVEADLRMIDQSDVLLAYFNEDEQYGTIVEILYAISKKKPVAVFVSKRLVHSKYTDLGEENGESIYADVYKTNHGCPCMIDTELDETKYWFLLHTLKTFGVPIIFNEGSEILTKMRETLAGWIKQKR